MSIIDTHAHLDFEQFQGEEEAVVARAKAAGVDRIINVGTTMLRSKEAILIAERFPNIWASVGVHPHDAGEVSPETVEELSALARNPKVVAVGEIGVDRHYDDGPGLAKQEEAFLQQAAVAIEHGLPVIVHSRDAEEETLACLRKVADELPKPPGVIHCFTGSQQFADQVLELGFFISFTATITYPKNDSLREVVKNVPLEKIFVETDCPFLAPQDKRGKRNEPAYVVSVVEQIASLKRLLVEEVATQTTKNAERLFTLA